MGRPDCACKHGDKLAAVHHLTCYYSSISDKKDSVARIHLSAMTTALPVCQRLMDDVFG